MNYHQDDPAYFVGEGGGDEGEKERTTSTGKNSQMVKEIVTEWTSKVHSIKL